VLGAGGEDVIGIMQAARNMRWRPAFLCPLACYMPELAALGGDTLEGLYAVGEVAIPYPDDPVLKDWARRYEAKYATAPSAQALTGYRNARMFLAALERTGRTPTQEALRHALESMGPWSDPDLGGPILAFSPEDHSGQHRGFLAQARGGRWAIIPDRNPDRL